LNPTIRIGLAGLGVHGERYAAHLLRGDVPGAVLAAISRSDRVRGRAFAAEHGVAFVADALELACRPGIDAVVAVLPPDLHPPLALACLEAGRPVLVEKPVAPNGDSAARVARRAADTGTPLMVAHTLRFDPLVERLRREIPSLGALRLVAVSQRFEPSSRPWLDAPGPGGLGLNTGVHGFDLIRHLTGAEIVSITAETRSVVTGATDDEIAAVMRLEPGGLLATLDGARTTRGRSGRIEIAGERGQLAGDHVHRWLHAIEGRSITELGPVAPSPTVVAVLSAFLDALRRNAPPPVSAEDGRAAVEAVDAALRSARTGRRVWLGAETTGLHAGDEFPYAPGRAVAPPEPDDNERG
jgi:predicted dehydrogenase